MNHMSAMGIGIEVVETELHSLDGKSLLLYITLFGPSLHVRHANFHVDPPILSIPLDNYLWPSFLWMHFFDRWLFLDPN